MWTLSHDDDDDDDDDEYMGAIVCTNVLPLSLYQEGKLREF